MQQLIEYHAQLSDKVDYAEIGCLLGIAGKLDAVGRFTVQQPTKEQHVVNAVKWSAAKANTKWLLVVDNLDDIDSFDLNNYIPPYCHGTVIITSRRPEIYMGEGDLEWRRCRSLRLLLKSARRRLDNLTPGSK